MAEGIFKYFFVILLTNTTFGNLNNKESDALQPFYTFNNADKMRSVRHVEFATETTLSHVLNTIARNYPDLKTTKGQSMEKIKEQIRKKLRQYMKMKHRMSKKNKHAEAT